MAVESARIHANDESPSPAVSQWADVLRRAKRSKATIIGTIMVLLMLAIAVFAPWIAPYDPATQFEDGLEFGLPHKPFANKKFILGTDHLGRDVLSRLIYGSRISLLVGFTSVVVASAVGVALGLISGYYGGVIDMIVMRLTDVIMAFPSFLLSMAILSSLKPGIMSLLISISIARWAGTARLARSQALAQREHEYVEAAKALGIGNFRILVKYILPNSYAPILVNLTMGIAGAILTEASLSFLGLGVQPPTPSWGMMVNEARGYMFLRPSLVFIPAFAIAFAVLGFSVLGDGLRDVLDPKLRGSS
ncbi:MAG: ABC transporter permease [Firmicutes bacterium]|jgi:peptide/nickel transport system permease protein/oligopeptide transport system permease protein|nr:ABC transporter permease [Bacillota bacterium]